MLDINLIFSGITAIGSFIAAIVGFRNLKLVSNNNKASNKYTLYSKIIEIKTAITNLEITWEDTYSEYYNILRLVSNNTNHPQISANLEKRKRMKFEMLNLDELLLKIIIDIDDKEIDGLIGGCFDDIVKNINDTHVQEIIQEVEGSYPLFEILINNNYDLKEFRKKIKLKKDQEKSNPKTQTN